MVDSGEEPARSSSYLHFTDGAKRPRRQRERESTVRKSEDRESIQTVVIGAGQAGLSAGYHLKKLGLPFLIIDANKRVGDVWRNRWDSLRLFTPARFDALPGTKFPAPRNSFVTKDEMGDYLESYAEKYELPVSLNTRVDRLSRDGDKFMLTAGSREIEAENVIVAMGKCQVPRVPSFADELGPDIVQMHSNEYKNPEQLNAGPVLVVGAGNSGSEVAMDLRHTHEILMSGRSTGQLPFRIDTPQAKMFLLGLTLRVMFHRVLTVNNPIGRKMRPSVFKGGGPLIRVKRKDLSKAGVERVTRVDRVVDGRPVLEDGTVPEVENVIWCTGYDSGFSWIDLPVLGEHEPNHHRGVVEGEPGLYFTGLEFQYALSSGMVQGAGRDAEYVVRQLAKRVG